MKRLFILLWLVNTPAWATTYYVATTGSNGNSCAQASQTSGGIPTLPKLTINAGVTCATNSGDRVEIRGGTYNGGSLPNPITSGITIAKFAGDSAVVMTSSTFDVYSSSNITIDGLVDNGFQISSGLMRIGRANTGDTASSNITVKYVTAGPIGSSCFCGGFMPGFNQGTAGLASNITLSHVKSHNVGDTAVDHGVYVQGSNITVEYSELYDNGGDGITVFREPGATDNVVLRNNNIHGNGGWGISFADGTGSVAYNNIVRGNGGGNPEGGGGVRFFSGTNQAYYNNTIYSSTGDGIRFESGTSGNIARGNISYNNSGAAIQDNGSSDTSNSNITSNPSFVNAGSNDFHLTSGSIARNAGPNFSSIFSNDYDGVSRPPAPTAWDAGAFQFAGTSPVSLLRMGGLPKIVNFAPSALSCTAGDWAIQLDAATGHKIWVCSAANTWDQQ